MAKDPFNEILKIAKGKEEGSFNVYSECAKKAKNAIARDFFLKLAEEEKGHLKHLEDISRRDIKNYDVDKVNELKVSNYLIDVNFDENMSIQDVILYAIKREGHAIDFYKRLSSATTDAYTKKIFNFLKTEEIGHKKHLEEIYEKSLYQFF